MSTNQPIGAGNVRPGHGYPGPRRRPAIPLIVAIVLVGLQGLFFAIGAVVGATHHDPVAYFDVVAAPAAAIAAFRLYRGSRVTAILVLAFFGCDLVFNLWVAYLRDPHGPLDITIIVLLLLLLAPSSRAHLGLGRPLAGTVTRHRT